MRIAFVLIVALLWLTTVLPYNETKGSGGSNAATFTNEQSSQPDTAHNNVYQPSNYGSFALLRLSAGKRWSYTQHELDSIQNIISIRKKF